MNRNTRIEWARTPDGKPGDTWNPICGCSRRKQAERLGCAAPGCATSDKCWAAGQAKRQRKRCQQCYEFTPHLHPERLDEPARRRKPSGIFVCSMGELFDPALDFVKATAEVFGAMCMGDQHRFYVLTKHPNRIPLVFEHVAPRDNWWFGTSASAQAELERRVSELMRIREMVSYTPILFASVEPILGPVALPPGLDWVIIGAQTGAGAVRPDWHWIDVLVRQCQAAGVPVFVKDNARGQWNEHDWPQEVPK